MLANYFFSNIATYYAQLETCNFSIFEIKNKFLYHNILLWYFIYKKLKLLQYYFNIAKHLYWISYIANLNSNFLYYIFIN